MENSVKPKKIILITIDCLRYDHLQCLNLTLNDFISFDNCYTAGEPTPFSFPSLFQSIYFSKEMEKIGLKKYPTFVELLKKEGFTTAGFSGANFFCSHMLGYHRGFDYFDDFLLANKSKKFKKYLPQKIKKMAKVILSSLNLKYVQQKNYSKEIVKKSLKVINHHKKDPLFLWMHFMDAHFPYRLPNLGLIKNIQNIILLDKLARSKGNYKIKKKEVIKIKKFYKNALGYIGSLLNYFFANINLDEFDIIISSDHGEEFGERDHFGHHANVHEEITHVPLLIKSNNDSAGKEKKGFHSLLDIPSTILSLAHINQPQFFQGYPIFKKNRSFVISEASTFSFPSDVTLNQLQNIKLQKNDFIYSIRDKKYSLINKNNHFEIYNRQQDRYERNSLKKENKEIKKLKKIINIKNK